AGMDDVLSKPLAVPALTSVIKQYWDYQDEPDQATADVSEQGPIREALLDIPMLQQYLDLVGPSLIHQSVAMFEQMMPGYLAVLDFNMTARDQKGVAEEGHKIKGAASSVGLRHLQQVVQQIQTTTLPAWWDNVQEWIDELKHDWRHDIDVLKAWVAEQEKRARKQRAHANAVR
ncbi:aerobic respiration two-component sensor histidine kinase ArcB, partial [BEV proteobacterium]|nr:aerobic respiration two-component sensor histidine kinase ArcB [Candidatus Symbiopectobacterium sp. Chty_BC]